MWDLIVSVPDHCLSFYLLLELFIRFTASAFRKLPSVYVLYLIISLFGFESRMWDLIVSVLIIAYRFILRKSLSKYSTQFKR